MISAMVLAGLAMAASPRPGKGDSAVADSLRGLQVLISSEIRGGNQVLHLQDESKADSLLRAAKTREDFVGSIRDRSVSRQIRNEADFKDYWGKVEAEAGVPGLRGRLAAADVDKSRVPKRYLFDSSVVVYPGWVVLRRIRR